MSVATVEDIDIAPPSTDDDGTFVTFVTPTIGRASLATMVESLKRQTDPAWEAIIVGDGIEPIYPADDRITSFTAEGTGSAGLTRNRAFEPNSPYSPWVAFVDDDDALAPRYVEQLKIDAKHGTDVVVMRMDHPDLGILPSFHDPRIEWGQVGISFAVRTHHFDTLRFIQETNVSHRFGRARNEDIGLLNDLKKRGARMYISPYVGYLVRPGVSA